MKGDNAKSRLKRLSWFPPPQKFQFNKASIFSPSLNYKNILTKKYRHLNALLIIKSPTL